MVRLFSQYIPVRTLVYLALETLLIFLFLIIQIRVAPLKGAPPLGQILLIPLVFQLCFYYGGAFGMHFNHSQRTFLVNNLQGIAVSFAVLLFLYTVLPNTVVSRDFFLPNLFLLPVVLLVARMACRKVLEGERLKENILIIGSDKIGTLVQEEVHAKKWLGYKVLSRIDETRPDLESRIEHWVQKHRVDKVIVAVADRRGRFPLETLLNLKVKGIEVLDGVAFYERLKGKILIDTLKPAWLIFSEGFKRPWRIRIAKRMVDIVLAIIGLLLTIPLFAIVPLLVKLESRGPVFFRQKRVGENGEEFWLIKFRSMEVDAEAQTGPVWASEKDPRVTPLGYYLRKLRIDEIPQMINVLKGEMSLVGPRPERLVFVEKLKKAIPYYTLRLSVKPGITGWAQVKYPYGASEKDAIEKLQYELYYIKNLSLLLDLTILFSTIHVILMGKGSR